MEVPAKWAAQKSQVDVAAAIEEKNVRVKLAAQYEAEAYELRGVVAASGSENQRRAVELQGRVAELQTENVQLQELLRQMLNNTRVLQESSREWMQMYDGLEAQNLDLRVQNQRLQFDAAGVENQASREKAELQRSEGRLKKQLARARKSRDKFKWRLYALRRKVCKACGGGRRA